MSVIAFGRWGRTNQCLIVFHETLNSSKSQSFKLQSEFIIHFDHQGSILTVHFSHKLKLYSQMIEPMPQNEAK